MEYLKTPLLHGMNAFLLNDSHDRIRQFREACRSGRGLLVKREREKELDFWDWELSRVKDLALHKAFREACGIEECSRYYTGWKPHGILKLPPRLWPELADMWNHRRLDLIDCFGSACGRCLFASIIRNRPGCSMSNTLLSASCCTSHSTRCNSP